MLSPEEAVALLEGDDALLPDLLEAAASARD